MRTHLPQTKSHSHIEQRTEDRNDVTKATFNAIALRFWLPRYSCCCCCWCLFFFCFCVVRVVHRERPKNGFSPVRSKFVCSKILSSDHVYIAFCIPSQRVCGSQTAFDLESLCILHTHSIRCVCVAFGKLLHGENLRVWNFVRTFVPFGLYFACDKWRGCWSMRTQPMARVCIIPSAHFNVLFNSNTRFSSILLATRLILALVASAIWWIASCKNVSRGFCCCYIGCVSILSRHIVLCVVAVDFFFVIFVMSHVFEKYEKRKSHTVHVYSGRLFSAH